jgi:addiction module HigA family antidote
MEHPAVRSPDRCPAHPGELLRKVIIPATGRSKTAIASLLGISRQHLYDILRERKPVTPNVAVRLGKLFGDGPGVWVRMQAAHGTWHAARGVDTSGIPTLDAA